MVLGAVGGYDSYGTYGVSAGMPAVEPVQVPSGMAGPSFEGGVQGVAAPQAGDDAAKIAEGRAFAKLKEDEFNQACQTCKNRKYQDGSDDPGVSFQTPQSIDPGSSASVVAGHEMEHVAREQFKAESEGGKVVMQTVQLHGDICPECGTFYIAGGTTRTVTQSGGENADAGQQDAPQPQAS